VAPPGAGKVGAFFDVDHTLLAVNSGARWLRHAWRTGQTSSLQALRALGWLVRYRLALLDLEAVSALAVRIIAGTRRPTSTRRRARGFAATSRRTCASRAARASRTIWRRGTWSRC
jgi:hypothetical protein